MGTLLIDSKIANKITEVSKSSQQNNSEIETEILKEDLYPQKKGSKLLMN